MFLKTHHEQK